MTAPTAPERGSGIAVLSLPGAVFFAGVLGFAAWIGQTPLVFLCALVLAVTGVSRGWSRLSVTRLVYHREMSTTRAFPGDSVAVSVVLDNRKLLPLTWVETTDPMPEALGGDLGLSTALLWYQRARRERAIECRRRGYYPIGPARVATGDIFGLFPREREAAAAEPLIVYPRLHPVGAFGLPSRHPLGETKSTSRLFEDPSRAMGLREYTPDVPFRHIHWKASARHRELQVKVFEPSATVKTALFLDVDGFDSESFELAASVTASLAHHLIDARQAVGIYANATQAGGGGCPAARPSGGAVALTGILEALARIDPPAAESFADFLDTHSRGLPWGTTICLVALAPSVPVIARLRALRRSGFPSVIVQLGADAIDAGGIPVRHVHAPADLERLA